MLHRVLRRALSVVALAVTLPTPAWAGRILFVSDSETDRNIPAALRAAGHLVDVVLNDYGAGNNNTRLQASLAGYDAVFWSATGGGRGDIHTTATAANLTSYVTAGGYLFVTGSDVVVSPPDPVLVSLLGATDAIDLPGAPAAAINAANELTTGVVDLRGVVPTGASGDRDALLGVGADTTVVVASGPVPAQAQWTVRAVGEGRIAFVSNGDGGSPSEAPSWRDTSAGGAGAYNAALRNFAFHASGARVLFVSDSRTDTNIPDVLRGDGHRVTVVLDDFAGGNARLRGSLAGYDAVVWSATGNGFGDVHDAAMLTGVTSYVRGGGFVFVTGNDSVVSPSDPPLIGFLGATDGVDLPGAPAAVIDAVNELTTGVADLRGVSPTGANGDRDALIGLGADTVAVVTTSGSPMLAQWTLRTVGAGRIAYVSGGQAGPASAHPSWTTTTGGGAAAYNAALRNFVFHASGARVLFVSDSQTDTNIPDVLRGDGHRVTVVLDDFAGGNARLRASLAGYDVVVWSATGAGFGDVHDGAVFGGLTSFVRGGGGVFVTGNDSIASPTDLPLIGFVGGTGSVDLPGVPTAVTAATNALTAGVVDVRGAVPTGANGDRDGLTGVGVDTAVVVGSAGGPSAQWTLRTLGAGRIAYVSGGQAGPASAHPSWTTTAGGGAAAYNAALRNFVYAVDRGPVGVVTGAANGTGCVDASQCGSGYCVDGVCCNSACGGGAADCQACTVAAGAAANGTCGAVAAGRLCRASAGVCDAAESCDGAATACPADGFAADGTSCADAVTCNGAETCRAGVCAAGTVLNCNDNNACTTDRCAEPTGCVSTPIGGCADAGMTTDAGGVRDAGVDVPLATDVVTVVDAGMPTVDVLVVMDAGVPTVDVPVAVDVPMVPVDMPVAVADVPMTAVDTPVAVDAGMVAVDVGQESDAAVETDVETSTDALVETDVAVLVDAAVASDTTAATDVSATADVGAGTDAAVTADIEVDGGVAAPGPSAGCGCVVAGSESSPRASGWALLGLGLVGLGRRRRRSETGRESR